MKGLAFAAVAALVLALSTASQLRAQQSYTGLPGDDVASLALKVGAVAQTTTLPDGASFDPGAGAGLSVNVWPFTHVGFGGSVFYGRNKGDPGPNNALAGQEDPSLLTYDLELKLRRPMNAGGLAWFPFIGGGMGGKTYRWSEWFTGHEWDTTYSWGFTTGVEFRPVASPWYGFLLEVKRYSSNYKWHGYHFDHAVVSDLTVAAGVTLNH